MSIKEQIELVFVGIGNYFYNLWLTVYELFLFGLKPWWWKVKGLYFFEYFFSWTYRIVRRESQDFDYDEDNFIYGETPCITVKRILDAVEHKPGDVFVDLGSGRGFAVIFAHFLGNLKTRGYELIPSFVRKGRKIAGMLGTDDISFFQEDILKAEIKDAAVVFIAGTTFPDDFVVKLNKKLRETPDGSSVVTLSYPLPDKYFVLYREMELLFSWGKATVFFQRRRSRKSMKIFKE